MELLTKVAANLERHAEALDRLADELEQSAPAAGTQAAQAWAEEDVGTRIHRMRREARLARRAAKRVETTLEKYGDDVPELPAAQKHDDAERKAA